MIERFCEFASQASGEPLLSEEDVCPLLLEELPELSSQSPVGQVGVAAPWRLAQPETPGVEAIAVSPCA